LYNCKALVQRLIIETGKIEWDAAMPELLMFLIEKGMNVEQF
jgi:hypothetical protein